MAEADHTPFAHTHKTRYSISCLTQKGLNVDNQQALIEKRDRMAKWLKVGAVAAVGIVAAPFVMLAIGGIAGLAVAAALAIAVVNLAPWFSLKMANLRYRMIESEKVQHIKKVTDHAAENPIETLTNLLIQKKQAFNEFKAAVERAVTARDNFKGKVENFSRKYPHRAVEFQKQLERMSDLVERKKSALADARKSLEEGDHKLEEMKAYWEMSKDAIEANRAAGMDTGDAFEKLKADTACDAVFESMNAAFAQLEVAAALEDDPVDDLSAQPAQLTHSEPVVVNATARETQKVRR